MTQYDARAEVHLLMAIALQNFTASSTYKTYSSVWTAGARVSEVYKYPVDCMDTVTPLDAVQEAVTQYII
jgi:hypothetical protein